VVTPLSSSVATSAQPLLARAGDVLARYSWQHAADLTLAEIERIARR
jgi:hypothetical protein